MVVHITDAFRQWMSRNGCGTSGSLNTSRPSATTMSTLEVLLRLTADDLRELGVTSIGHRRRLLDAIAALTEGAPEPAAMPAATVTTARARCAGALGKPSAAKSR